MIYGRTMTHLKGKVALVIYGRTLLNTPTRQSCLRDLWKDNDTPKRQSCLSDLRNEKCIYDGVPTPALSVGCGDLASDTEVCSYLACHSPRTKTHTSLPPVAPKGSSATKGLNYYAQKILNCDKIK